MLQYVVYTHPFGSFQIILLLSRIKLSLAFSGDWICINYPLNSEMREYWWQPVYVFEDVNGLLGFHWVNQPILTLVGFFTYGLLGICKWQIWNFLLQVYLKLNFMSDSINGNNLWSIWKIKRVYWPLKIYF